VPGLLVIVPVYLLLLLGVLIDAFVCGRCSGRAMLGGPVQRYLAGVALVAISIVWHRAIERPLRAAFRAAGEEAFVTNSSSMSPTIRPGDRVLTHRSATVSRWDLVVYHPPGKTTAAYIGRVAGLPGEKLEIVDGGVNINGVPTSVPRHIAYNQPGFGSPRTGCAGHRGVERTRAVQDRRQLSGRLRRERDVRGGGPVDPEPDRVGHRDPSQPLLQAAVLEGSLDGEEPVRAEAGEAADSKAK